MKYSLLHREKDDILNPSVVSGVGKRANVLMRYLESIDSLSGVYDYDDIENIDKDSIIIAFNIEEQHAFDKLESRNLKVCNSYCSGADKPTNKIYTSKNIKVRFLSEAVKNLCDGFFDEENSFVCHHGFGDFEYKSLDREKKYFLWCASLGWGPIAKGLNHFVRMANLNPNYEFLVYGGKWNSAALEHELLKASDQISNLTVKFDLADEDKDEVFSQALAFCQFSLLIEAGNVLTIESLLRNTPVVTLDVDNGSVKEYLSDDNIKMHDYLINDEFLNQINSVRERLIDKNIYRDKFSCESEIKIIANQFL